MNPINHEIIDTIHSLPYTYLKQICQAVFTPEQWAVLHKNRPGKIPRSALAPTLILTLDSLPSAENRKYLALLPNRDFGLEVIGVLELEVSESNGTVEPKYPADLICALGNLYHEYPGLTVALIRQLLVPSFHSGWLNLAKEYLFTNEQGDPQYSLGRYSIIANNNGQIIGIIPQEDHNIVVN